MDRTMAKRKMLLKKMLNGHHMSAAGGDSLAAGGTKRDAVAVVLRLSCRSGNPNPKAKPANATASPVFGAAAMRR